MNKLIIAVILLSTIAFAQTDSTKVDSTKLVLIEQIQQQMLNLQNQYNNEVMKFRDKHKDYYYDYYYLQIELNAILTRVNILNEQLNKIK